jgi:hypothetical protein
MVELLLLLPSLAHLPTMLVVVVVVLEIRGVLVLVEEQPP